ncbi:hypothetical protein [Nodularia chucula]
MGKLGNFYPIDYLKDEKLVSQENLPTGMRSMHSRFFTQVELVSWFIGSS